MLGIMASINQKAFTWREAALVVDSGIDTCMGGFVGIWLSCEIVAALIAVYGSGMVNCCFCRCFCRVAFPSVVFRPKMLGIMVGMTRETVLRLHMAALSSTWQWHLHGWFCWFDAVRAGVPSLVGRPAAKSSWPRSWAAAWFGRFAGEDAHLLNKTSSGDQRVIGIKINHHPIWSGDHAALMRKAIRQMRDYQIA